jgi:hypothetical protein
MPSSITLKALGGKGLGGKGASHPTKYCSAREADAVSGDSAYKEICASRSCIYQHNQTLPICYKKKGRYCFLTSSILHEEHTSQRG